MESELVADAGTAYSSIRLPAPNVNSTIAG